MALAVAVLAVGGVTMWLKAWEERSVALALDGPKPGLPVAPGGMTLDGALRWDEQNPVSGPSRRLTQGELNAPFSDRDHYIDVCGLPRGMWMRIDVAVKYGTAVGVTVDTDPDDPALKSCIDGRIRGLAWPWSSMTQQSWVEWTGAGR